MSDGEILIVITLCEVQNQGRSRFSMLHKFMDATIRRDGAGRVINVYTEFAGRVDARQIRRVMAMEFFYTGAERALAFMPIVILREFADKLIDLRCLASQCVEFLLI